MSYQGYKSSSIRAGSQWAEVDPPSLSEIDSMYQNGEITQEQARDMAIKIAMENREGQVVLALCR